MAELIRRFPEDYDEIGRAVAVLDFLMGAMYNTGEPVFIRVSSLPFIGSTQLNDAISTEVSNRNTAISTAINTLKQELIAGAPDALNAFNELAAALNNDANFATSIFTLLAGKATNESLSAEILARNKAIADLEKELNDLQLRGNLFQNSDFSDGITGWNINYDSATEIKPEVDFYDNPKNPEGARALQIVTHGANNGIWYQWAEELEKKYTITFWVKAGTIPFTLWYGNESDLRTETITDRNWKKLIVEINPLTSDNSHNIVFYTPTPGIYFIAAPRLMAGTGLNPRLKTINNQSLFGSGNIIIESTGGGTGSGTGLPYSNLGYSDMDMNDLTLAEGEYNYGHGQLLVRYRLDASTGIRNGIYQYRFSSAGMVWRVIEIATEGNMQEFPEWTRSIGVSQLNAALANVLKKSGETINMSGADWYDSISKLTDEGNYIIIDADDSDGRPAILPAPGQNDTFQYNCTLKCMATGNPTLDMHLVGTNRNFVWDLTGNTINEIGSGSSESSASDISYTNSTYPTVAAALDKLLYVAPSITSFTGGSTVEIGSSVTPVLNWLYNKTMTDQKINGTVELITNRSKTMGAVTSDTTYSLWATDGTNQVNGSQSVLFRFYKFWGTGATPAGADSTSRRAAIIAKNPTFQAISAGSFVMATGSTETNFYVCLPPGLVLSSALDTTANAAVSFDSPVNYIMKDAGGVDRTYKMYTVTLGQAFSSSHNWTITIQQG